MLTNILTLTSDLVGAAESALPPRPGHPTARGDTPVTTRPATAAQASASDDPSAKLTKGQRTRAQLIVAAREVFAEQGYFTCRLTDITDRVGCSTGTLYTYFRNREDILAAIIQEYQETVLHAPAPEEPDTDPVARIQRANRHYIDSYSRNADLMAVMEQVAHVDADIRKLREARSTAFVKRNARSIARLQKDGAVDASLDAHLVSRALSLMVSRLCYRVYVQDKDPAYLTDEGREELSRTLSVLWTNALGLTPAR